MASEGKSRLNTGHSLRILAPEYSSTSRWRRNRPSANLSEQIAQPAPTPKAPANPPTPKLERAPSKMSLFNLFSRPKVEKARGHTEVGLALPMPPQPPPKLAPVSTPKSSLRLNPRPPVQQVQRSRSSQMLRPMSLKPPSARPQPESWAPPPLFQAYPQSIKYATVQACVFSPDALLRTQSQRRQYDLVRERIDSHRDLSTTLEGVTESKKLERSHKRLTSSSILNSLIPQLTNKIYVLVTSGHVLQYSGEGPFDRLPEKVLKLGKESAAFACDLIPGKHWVLQISQSANEDGTVIVAPKNNLLSRLRNTSVRRAATSFLLVLESAEEMDAWLTAVRKEIDQLGGMKAPESIRESSSSDESSGKQSIESSRQRYLVQRDPNRIKKMAPIDSPQQSQYSDSPRIVASDWEGDRSEKTVSIADSTSSHSYHQNSKRLSMEASSIATTAVSYDQLQLDQLRGGSRLSYMSAATSVSGAGTRNTSRTSSPAPTSPLQEGFSPADAEPLRSATSLKSFHMNPRRRSMQPLPTTNEDNSLPAETLLTPQRQSIYGPPSPTSQVPGKSDLDGELPTPTTVARPTYNPRLSMYLQTQTPARYNARSSSAPPTRNSGISPPPREPAPGPPATRRQSTFGDLPTAGTRTGRPERRISTTPKPFLRPFPVRPQAQHADASIVVPRRYTSLASVPAPLPLGVVINRPITTPARPPSATATFAAFPTASPQTTSSAQQLRRPNSVQIRSDPAPFLSSARHGTGAIRAVSSTPSFVQGRRASAMPTTTLQPSPSISVLRSQSQHPYRAVTPRRSMPVMSLPPPAPPPNMPLPPPPPMSTTRPPSDASANRNPNPNPNSPSRACPVISPSTSTPTSTPPTHRNHAPAPRTPARLHAPSPCLPIKINPKTKT
ncbi:hypothetical protein BDV95DRAFT_495523 [Massariosphaeria phaeospora]|uniref:PH domain-containing protein n=1 Tax=Massariosphaeria phaeospora TaxID=100035 RepID=A0A7C8M584_9PLEO|nr:hypothetical protein BDV95DRAFT_495523 [Massariosphaeria phaeospora]